ncbi:MAG: phytase, partial [bacterium]
MFVRTLTTLLASATLLTACATREVDYQGEGEGFIGTGSGVTARLETPSVGTAGQDAADDPAIWTSPAPVTIGGVATRGFVAGTDKKAGLYIYGLDGAILQF